MLSQLYFSILQQCAACTLTLIHVLQPDKAAKTENNLRKMHKISRLLLSVSLQLSAWCFQLLLLWRKPWSHQEITNIYISLRHFLVRISHFSKLLSQLCSMLLSSAARFAAISIKLSLRRLTLQINRVHFIICCFTSIEIKEDKIKGLKTLDGEDKKWEWM